MHFKVKGTNHLFSEAVAARNATMAGPVGPRRSTATRRPPILSGGARHRGSSYKLHGIPPHIWMPAVGITGTLVYSYYHFIEEVPLSKRKRWIATTTKYERELGDQEYKNLVKGYANQILPPSHPVSPYESCLDLVGGLLKDVCSYY